MEDSADEKISKLIAQMEGISPKEVTAEYIHMRRMEMNPELYGELGKKEVTEIKKRMSKKTLLERNLERGISGLE